MGTRMEQPADITQALKDTENALRDFISATLARRFGGEWGESMWSYLGSLRYLAKTQGVGGG